MNDIDVAEAEHLVSLFRAMTEAKAAAIGKPTEANLVAADATANMFEEAARTAMARIRAVDQESSLEQSGTVGCY